MKPKYLNIKNNVAHIRDVNLIDVAKEFKTPLYVFDQFELEENMELFAKHFKSDSFNCHTVYASKAFLIPEVCKLLVKHGLWMDAVSLGDLYVAYKSGFPMEHIIFHGNNKSYEELEFALMHNCVVVIDHLEELQLLDKICQKNNKTINTMFRVNPGIDAHTHKYIQTATYVSKFGESMFDEATLDKVMKEFVNSKYVKLLGFHSHIGSQIQELEPFLLNVTKMLSFSKQIMDKYNYPLTSVNFGGGFGIPYINNDMPLDKKLTTEKMIELIESLGKEINFVPKDVFIEPGRSIVGNSCVTLYTCGDFKHTFGDKNYQFIDGGMTDNIRPALYDAEYACDVVNKMTNEKNVVCDIAGKCCESGDIIIYNALLPKTENGDILMVYATGAYNYSMASNYNNMLKPAVVFIENQPKLVARRETLDDLLKLFK